MLVYFLFHHISGIDVPDSAYLMAKATCSAVYLELFME
jgi:hypothetical protein